MTDLPKPNREAATQALQTGMAAFKADDYATAERCFWDALSADGDCADAWHMLGLIARSQNGNVAASAMFRRAVELFPDSADAWMNYGEALQNCKRMEDAEKCHLHALAMNPNIPLAWNNVGVIWENWRQYGKAEKALRKAMELDPELNAPRINLTRLYMQTANYQSALNEARLAVETCPDFPQAHFNLGLCLLQQGDWLQGWREYEWRWRLPAFIAENPPVMGPSWDGSNPKGKTILLFAEQGFGDSIQFARYARPIADAGGRVLLSVQDPIAPLLCHADGVAHAFGRSEGLPTFDFCAPLMSLPYLFDSTPDKVTVGRYIDPPPHLLWADRINALPGKRIGICWAGSRKHANDFARSMEVSDLLPLADVPGVSWVNLQFDRGETVKDASIPLLDYSPDCRNFLDSAQLIDQLDMVITVDTAIAHLAGSLGVPCVTLLPPSSDFRWMLHRPDTPWYPSMRLARRLPGESWIETVRKLADDLIGAMVEPVAA